MTRREIDAHEVVRWIESLERRCRRLRWIALGGVLLAAVALVLPALPFRVSPWESGRIEVHEVSSPELRNTGHLSLGVHEGEDPRLVLRNANRVTRANLEIHQGAPLLDLHDVGGRLVSLRLAPTATEFVAGDDPAREIEDLERRASGFLARWPGSTPERSETVRLGGDGEVLSLQLASARNGEVRLYAGRRDAPNGLRFDEDRRRAIREPGAAVQLLDPQGTRRVDLGLVRPPPPPPPEDGSPRAEAPGARPALVLRDEVGKIRARLGLDDDGTPSLVFFDENGSERAILTLDEIGDASLVLRDPPAQGEKGEVRWRAP